MRVDSGYDPYAYQRQGRTARTNGFAELFAAAMSPDQGEAALEAPLQEEEQTDWLVLGLNGVDLFIRLHQQMGVDTGRTPNLDSAGDRALTKEQVAELRAKYDVENLSAQERYDLLCDLTDLGVLTAEDINHLYMRTIVNGGVLVEASPGQGAGIPAMDPADLYAYMKATVDQNDLLYNLMLELGNKGQREPHETKADEIFQLNKDKIDAMMGAHRKVFAVLEQLR